MASSDLSHYTLGDLTYMQSPAAQFKPVTAQSIIARKRMNYFLEDQVKTAMNIFFEDRESHQEVGVSSGSSTAK